MEEGAKALSCYIKEVMRGDGGAEDGAPATRVCMCACMHAHAHTRAFTFTFTITFIFTFSFYSDLCQLLI